MLERYEQIEQEIEDESSEKYDFPTKFEWDSSDKVSEPQGVSTENQIEVLKKYRDDLVSYQEGVVRREKIEKLHSLRNELLDVSDDSDEQKVLKI